MSMTITTIETPTAARYLPFLGISVAPVAAGAWETSAFNMLDPQPTNAVSRVRDAKQAAPPRGEVH